MSICPSTIRFEPDSGVRNSLPGPVEVTALYKRMEQPMKRTLYVGFATIALLLMIIPICAAQDSEAQEPSLGSYARNVRKDKDKKSQTAKNFDNDNLPKDDKLSVVGPASERAQEAPPSAPAPTAADSSPNAAVTPGESPEQRQQVYDQWSQRISSQQSQVDLLQREFDVEQKEYRMRSAQFYADAGERMRNQAGWDKEDADYKSKIAEKQKALDDAKEALNNLQEEARKSGVPNSVREAAQQPPDKQ